jgi:ribonuclease BN (tRNA processing enzyme)
VRVTLVPSVVGCDDPAQLLTSVLLNDTVAIDAGCLGLWRSPREQARVKHVFLTHSHLDHLASLPIFLLNTVHGPDDVVTVWGGPAVLECLRRDLFNDRLWPDFVRISAQGRPYLRLQQLEAGVAVAVDGLRLTPVEVNHAVPTFGYLVEDDRAAVVFTSDTGPTQAIWELANRAPNLKAVFLEASNPNRLAWLANLARHLTPALFAEEVRKLRRPVPVYAVHLSPGDRDEIIRELAELKLPNVQVGRFGTPYQF